MSQNKLPKEFLQILKNTYPNKWQSILKILETKKPTTFRVNVLKEKSPKKILNSLKKQGFKIREGIIKNSYIILNNISISNTKEFKEGLIYVQELSSMLPPIILNPKKEEYILDMTAAPGSKTTQLAYLSNNKAKILAIEKNKIRYKRLKYNIKLQKAKVKTLNINAIILNKKFPEFNNFFDKILLDVPCSSEGRFTINKKKTYKYWNLRKVKQMQKTQKILINKAIQMLKPGGVLVYSTCTINTKENEEVIEWILNKYPSLKLQKINIKNLNKYVEKGKTVNTKKTIRIVPNNIFGGFYIAKIKKITDNK